MFCDEAPEWRPQSFTNRVMVSSRTPSQLYTLIMKYVWPAIESLASKLTRKLSVVREINKINQLELDLGTKGSWHDDYKGV